MPHAGEDEDESGATSQALTLATHNALHIAGITTVLLVVIYTLVK